MEAPDYFYSQFRSKQHAAKYLVKYTCGILDWDAWSVIYASYHNNRGFQEQISIYVGQAREDAQKWFFRDDFPLIIPILGMNTCHGYCEFDDTAATIYVDVAWFLKHEDKRFLIRNVALHELVHAARVHSGALKAVRALKDYFVEEGIAECIATLLTGFEFTALIQEDLFEATMCARVTDLFIEYWQTNDDRMISGLFTTGEARYDVIPGVGYLIASNTAKAWMTEEHQSIESVLSMNTDILAEIFFKRIGQV